MGCADRLTSFIYLQPVIHLAIENSINRSRGHCCSLDVGRSPDTRLLGEVRVGAMAESAFEESGFLPFSEDKREPSLAAGDGEATADARDVFSFSVEHHEEKRSAAMAGFFMLIFQELSSSFLLEQSTIRSTPHHLVCVC